jgi:uncharacterized membrane protein
MFLINPAQNKRITDLTGNISALKFFRITALCFGLAIVLIIPPFQVPDEADHFERAFHLAEGHFFGIQKDNGLGGEVPASIASLEEIYLPMKFDYNAKQTRSKYEKARAVELNPETVTFQDFPNTGVYAFSVYLPQVLTIKAGILLNIRPLYLLYITRFFTFMFWMLLISKAIQILPVQKWTLAFVALLPASLFINATASGDVVTNGVAFLMLAFCFRIILLKDAKISRTHFVWMGLGTGILALNKFVYAPVLLLSFLFPKAGFANPKHRNQFALGLLFFAVVIVAAWNLKTGELYIPKENYNPQFKEQVTLNEGVNPKEQLRFVLNNPVQFIKILTRSYFETSKYTVAQYFGKFGWEQNYLPHWTIVLLLLTTAFLSIQKSSRELSYKEKLIFLTIAFFISVMLATTLYMIWSPVGNEHILGLSGRYLIPVLPLVWLGLPQIISFRYQNLLIIAVTIPALTIGLIAAYLRYY